MCEGFVRFDLFLLMASLIILINRDSSVTTSLNMISSIILSIFSLNFWKFGSKSKNNQIFCGIAFDLLNRNKALYASRTSFCSCSDFWYFFLKLSSNFTFIEQHWFILRQYCTQSEFSLNQVHRRFRLFLGTGLFCSYR